MSKATKRTGNMATAIGYLRCSTDRQELGPEAQRASIEAWAAHHGVSVIGWHFDRGVSGSSDLAERPALMAAIGELRASRAGLLLIARRDRLARDTLVAGLIERAVAQCGATVVSSDGVGNGDDAASQFMRTILDGAAQYERALIRSRICAALAVKQARHERTGGIPYGFQVGSDGKTLEPHEGEQQVLRLARELRSAGMTLRDIAAELAHRGMRSRKGGTFAAIQISRMVAA